jgi:hypothetical protein
MKQHLRRAKAIGGTLIDAARRAVDPPLGADATPLEIRQAILELIEQQVQPLGGGRRKLPAPAIVASVLAPTPRAERNLEAVLEHLEKDAAGRLGELRCEVPPGFAIDITYVPARPADWEPDQWVDVCFSDRVRGRTRPVEVRVQPPLQITIVKGQAAQDAYTFALPVVRVGRSEAPTDNDGRPRQNDIAFLDDQAEENRTVTRGHARIQFSADRGDYRVFDEGSANGTQIVRGGNVIIVPKTDPMGAVLKSGDELRFGKASVRVQIGANGHA